MGHHMKYGLGVLLSMSMVSESFAIGTSFIGNEVPSARAAGAGYVGVAGQNNDPTAVYSNPGAMTGLKGTQFTAGVHYENIRGAYKDDAGAETKARMTNVVVPNFSMTQSFLDGTLSAGLSSQSPFGLETHWGHNSPMRYVATNSRLAMVDIMPAIAVQVHPMVSVGVGADYVNMFSAQLDRQIYTDGLNSTLGSATLGAPDATSSLRGQAANWGYHGGVVVQPHEQHSVGIVYHSKVKLRVNGNVTIRNLSGAAAAVFGGSDYSTSAYTDVLIPSSIQFGYAYKPNDRLSLEADAAYYHWSEGRDLRVRYSETDPTRLAVLNTGNPSSLNGQDSWSVCTGANYKMSDKVQVRTGFWYEPHALPESTFSPAFMDMSRYGLSAGTGYGITENLAVDVAYNAVFMHSRSIHNNVHSSASGVPDGTTLLGGKAESNGTYSNFANLLAVNFTYRFGAGK